MRCRLYLLSSCSLQTRSLCLSSRRKFLPSIWKHYTKKILTDQYESITLYNVKVLHCIAQCKSITFRNARQDGIFQYVGLNKKNVCVNVKLVVWILLRSESSEYKLIVRVSMIDILGEAHSHPGDSIVFRHLSRLAWDQRDRGRWNRRSRKWNSPEGFWVASQSSNAVVLDAILIHRADAKLATRKHLKSF